MSVESKILDSIDLDDVIDAFAALKARREAMWIEICHLCIISLINNGMIMIMISFMISFFIFLLDLTVPIWT